MEEENGQLVQLYVQKTAVQLYVLIFEATCRNTGAQTLSVFLYQGEYKTPFA
jgi:hypothetical protein